MVLVYSFQLPFSNSGDHTYVPVTVAKRSFWTDSHFWLPLPWRSFASLHVLPAGKESFHLGRTEELFSAELIQMTDGFHRNWVSQKRLTYSWVYPALQAAAFRRQVGLKNSDCRTGQAAPPPKKNKRSPGTQKQTSLTPHGMWIPLFSGSRVRRQTKI